MRFFDNILSKKRERVREREREREGGGREREDERQMYGRQIERGGRRVFFIHLYIYLSLFNYLSLYSPSSFVHDL